MGNSPLISVIIPVYNAELYLKQCVDSILMQSYPNIEIVLVNDSSTDNSGAICANYDANHSNIKVIQKENGGAAKARNLGLDSASGEFIIFQDADDYFDDHDGFQKLMDFYNSISYEVDLIFFNYKRFFQLNNKFEARPDFSKELIDTRDKDKKVEKLFLNAFIPAPPWGKLIKRKFLLENTIYFPPLRSSEDIPWFLELMSKSTNFTFTNLRIHVYRKQVSTSLTNSFSKSKYDTLFGMVKNSSLTFKASSDMKYRDLFLSFMAYQYLLLMAMSANMRLGSFLTAQKELKKMSWLLKYDKIKKVQQIQKLSKFMPQIFVSYLLHYYAKKVVNKK